MSAEASTSVSASDDSQTSTGVTQVTARAAPPRSSLNVAALRAQQRRFALTVNGVAAVGFVAACFQIAHRTVSVLDIALMVTMYSVSVLGVTVGFHRLFAHHAFQTTRAVAAMLAAAGAMSGQGPVIYWVALHRMHHQHSDAPGDPHSPNLFGDSLRGRLRGLAHAHLGWTIDSPVVNTTVFAKDLLRDPLISRVSRLSLVWLVLGIVGPALVGGLATLSLAGAWHGLVWGGLARMFISLQAVNSVNSICHMFGSRSFDTRERSGNVMALALPTFGEAWHHNHHAFPRSAFFSFRWWQFDPGGVFLQALALLGLAWSIQRPDASAVDRRAATAPVPSRGVS
jgi:stearoyl-CoA desaturase (delta-9 desaturase)